MLADTRHAKLELTRINFDRCKMRRKASARSAIKVRRRPVSHTKTHWAKFEIGTTITPQESEREEAANSGQSRRTASDTGLSVNCQSY